VHTRTHVKFDDDGESSDEEYQDLTAGKKDKAEGADEAMDVDGGVQGAGKAFDHELVRACGVMRRCMRRNACRKVRGRGSGASWASWVAAARAC
jgi:hypothetical protein